MAFVGREDELAQLAEAVMRAAEGRHARVVLTGPAGIGCTRLLDELVTRVAVVPGMVIGRGRAYEPTAGLPYQALGDALASSLDRVPDARLGAVLGNAGHDLCRLVMDLAERLDDLGIDHAPPTLQAPDQVGRRMLESLLGTLERLADGGVVLLILEDLHWADPATRAFIGSLLAMARALPICLVATYQPDELHRRHPARLLVERLRDEAGIARIELGPLHNGDIERMVETEAGVRPPGSVLGAVVEGARGNPLFATQLMAAATRLEGVRLSDSFEELCGARLEALPREAVAVVRVMSAARQPIKRQRLLRLHTPEGRLTVAGLETAVQGGLIARIGEVVMPAHELYAEAVEALELPLERHALHEALAQEFEDVPAIAAWHWTLAARPMEARSAHLRAAESASRVDPAETTQLHHQHALELPAAQNATPQELTSLLVGSARAAAASGSYRQAVALMRRAIENRTRHGRGARDEATRLDMGDMLEELGSFQWAGGDPEGAIDSLEQAMAILPERPSRVRARVLASLAGHLMIDSRFHESAQAAERARLDAFAAAAAGEETLAEAGHATCILGVDVAYLGEFDRGLGLLEEAASMARRAGRLDDLMRVAANRMWILGTLDARREQALAVVQEGIRDAQAGRLSATYGTLLRLNSVDILFQLGRWGEAEAESRAAIETPPPGMEWAPWLCLSLVLVESRADEEAARVLGQTLLELEAVPAGQWTALKLRVAVSFSIWRGAPGDALAIAEREWPRALETGDPTQIASAASTCLEAAAAAAEHGRLEHDAGLVARARTLAVVVIPAAEARVAGSTLDPALGARQEAELYLATARAHRARLRSAAKPERWAAIAQAWMERSIPYSAAKARWWQALAILEAGSVGEEEREAAREAARAPLAEAFALARALPALPLLREVLDLASRARVAMPSASGVVVPVAVHRDLVAVGPGRKGAAVDVARELPSDGPAVPGSGIAQAIEEQVLASLRGGPGDPYRLSPREREVLIVLAEGRTDRDIAARLFISQRTVHVHVRRILAKLGVSSRTEATGLAIRQGLVPMEAGVLAITRRRDAIKPADDVASEA